MGIIEDPYVDKWIFQRLSGSAVITGSPVGAKIFRGRWIPQGDGVVNLPCISYYRLYGYEKLTVNSSRVFNRLYYRIHVVNKTESVYGLLAIANEIDARIGIRAVQQVIDGVCSIEYAVRSETINREEEDNNERFQFLGGIYEIAAKAV